MLAGSGAGMGTRTGVGRAGNGTGLSSLPVNTAGPGPDTASETDGGQFHDREYSTEVIYSGSDQDSDSGDDEDTAGSGGDRRGVKRERSEREVGHQSAPTSGGLSGYGGVSPGVPGAKPGKKTRGRVKIKMEFIDNKLRRYTTFSKRKTGIMKKDLIKPAFTMSNLPGTTQTTPSSSSSSSTVSMQVQTSAPSWQPPSSSNGTVLKTSTGVMLPGGFTLMSGASLPPGTHTIPLSQLQGQPLAIQGPVAPGPAATLHAPHTQPTTLLRLPATVSLSGGGVSQQLQTIQVQPSTQQTSTNQSSSDIHIPASSAAGLPACIVSSSSSSSSSSVAGHMMYPGGHTVMYAAPTPSLGDGSLTVLNTFPPTGHAQSHDPSALPQVFLTSLPPVGAQIPVSAVQLHPMVISQQSSSNLTELQVVSLDVHQSKDD
ncbi:serum response factor-like isoform X3 [Siniperca chuatsi]|uniref:serum response factor-like isoform X3 n=1 Tax=Siniperca chuatsi TaxID=119488 RepID=UPI001CE10ACE|nr:serum response factor-like isoform X3 [Siniperca chuatsi]